MARLPVPSRSSNARMVYVIWVPPKEKVLHKTEEVYEKISIDLFLKNYISVFADIHLVTAAELSSSAVCLQMQAFENALQQGRYVAIHFYGNSITEFARAAVYTASRHRVRMVNWTDPCSQLDRYLQWFSGGRL